MSIKIDTFDSPRHINYLSFSKVDNIYAQITEMQLNSINKKSNKKIGFSGDVETNTFLSWLKAKLSFGVNRESEILEQGNLNHIQKMKKIINYCKKWGLIADLDKLNSLSINIDDYLLFSYWGEYTIAHTLNDNPSFFTSERIEANNYDFTDSYGRRVIGNILVFSTKIGDRKISLACSEKYFHFLGHSGCESYDDENPNIHYWKRTPSSVNWYYFSGLIKPQLRAIFIICGEKDGVLYGSPLVLYNEPHIRL